MGHRLYIYDAHSGKLRVSEGAFLTVGAAETNTFKVTMQARIGGTFACKGRHCRFFLHGLQEEYCINGLHLSQDIAIAEGEISLMVLAGGCFLCWYGKEEEVPDFSGFNSAYWYIYDMSAKAWSKRMKLSDICKQEATLPPESLVTFEGMNEQAFLARDIMEASRFALAKEKEKEEAQAAPEDAAYAHPRQITCPHCWERFMPDEMLAISANPELMGDKILGAKFKPRFLPTKHNAEGLPLDAKGSPCRSSACPHCHRKLPPFLSEVHQHIISIIGAPFSGKTYLLTTMIHEAFKEFPRDFGLSFRDTDPKLNAPFNALRQQFLTATDPYQAYFKNTELQDETAQRVWKKGAFRNLPAPTTFGVSRQGESSCYLVFHDTPGDCYLTGQKSGALATAAGHVNVASALFYIFDPTLSRSFRSLIPDSEDPQMQLELASTNLQTQMLSALEVQLREERNQPPPQKLHVPLAVVLDKSDVWLQLLGPEPLLPVVRNGRLQTACVESNSKRLRRLLFSIAPHVCANAEALSDNVRYFAVSSLGKSPVAFAADAEGGTFIGPESGAVSPTHITDPLLWALSTLEPAILPRNNS